LSFLVPAETFSWLLKKSLFSPALPRCAKTHLAPNIVQILNGDPAASPLGGAHRLDAPYSSHRAPQRVRFRSSLAAAFVYSTFESHANCSPRVPHITNNRGLIYPKRFSHFV